MGSWLMLLALAQGWSALTPAEFQAELKRLQKLPLAERLVQSSQKYVGVPYVVSPLGEGAGFDPDPLIRHDAVDCLTFVEQAMALSTSASPEALNDTLQRIRYAHGKVGYSTRNHVMEAQWLPNNQAAGFVRDVTAQWGGPHTKTVVKVITPMTWKGKVGQSLQLAVDAQALGRFELPLIPSSFVLGAVAHAPSGLLVVVIRADRPSSVTRISHLGILIQTPHGPMLRHASRTFGKVVDEPLARYVGRNLDFGTWTIEGLALYELQATAPVNNEGK